MRTNNVIHKTTNRVSRPGVEPYVYSCTGYGFETLSFPVPAYAALRVTPHVYSVTNSGELWIKTGPDLYRDQILVHSVSAVPNPDYILLTIDYKLDCTGLIEGSYAVEFIVVLDDINSLTVRSVVIVKALL